MKQCFEAQAENHCFRDLHLFRFKGCRRADIWRSGLPCAEVKAADCLFEGRNLWLFNLGQPEVSQGVFKLRQLKNLTKSLFQHENAEPKTPTLQGWLVFVSLTRESSGKGESQSRKCLAQVGLWASPHSMFVCLMTGVRGPSPMWAVLPLAGWSWAGENRQASQRNKPVKQQSSMAPASVLAGSSFSDGLSSGYI